MATSRSNQKQSMQTDERPPERENSANRTASDGRPSTSCCASLEAFRDALRNGRLQQCIHGEWVDVDPEKIPVGYVARSNHWRIIPNAEETCAFEKWWSIGEYRPGEPKDIARLAWDAAMCAAGSACLRSVEDSDQPPKDGNEIHAAITSLHSWHNAQGDSQSPAKNL